jgi:ABC-2 type transport system ATP-binding protein
MLSAGSGTADTLSVGQAAELGLAAALGTRAKGVLLDEPLPNLDPRPSRVHTASIGCRRVGGSTALLSEHVVTDVEDACDRLAIMGTREMGFQSLDSPKSEFVRQSGPAEN